MVRAILEGRKTQTRRCVNWKNIARQSGCRSGKLAYSDTFKSWAVFGGSEADVCLVDCPYGEIGDRLWVREKWAPYYYSDKSTSIVYAADCNDNKIGASHYRNLIDWPTPIEKRKPLGGCGYYDVVRWYPYIFMYREYSRINLEITGIRVERLQDISDEDAIAEGVNPYTAPEELYSNPVAAFADLWDSINEKRGIGWTVNPFVWVIEFKKV